MLRKVRVRVRVCMCACLRECMLCERMSVLACVPGEKVRACATVCVCLSLAARRSGECVRVGREYFSAPNLLYANCLTADWTHLCSKARSRSLVGSPALILPCS